MDISPRKDVVAPKPGASSSFMHMFDGIHFKFPSYKHEHPAVINVNEVADEELAFGQRIADKVASGMGSWRFIIIQSTILIVWAVLNSVGWWSWKWDLYPFIAMNLLLSCQAAYAAPVIMMSQNRQAEKDRLTAQNDYQTDCKGEEEIRNIMEHLEHQDTIMLQIMQRLEAQEERILQHLAKLDPEMAKRLGSDMLQVSEELADAEENADGNS